MVRHGWSGPYLLPSREREGTIALGSLCHGPSVLVGKRLIIIPSENLPWFNLFPLSLLSHLVPLVLGLAPSSPLPTHVGELLFAVPKAVLAPGWTRPAPSSSSHRETAPSPRCSGPTLHLVQFCHVFHVLEDQNWMQYSRCTELINTEWR